MTDSAIEIDRLTVCVPLGAELQHKIVQQVDWVVAQGETAAIIGPNGCGKSTLLRAITGYGHFTSGRVRLLGKSLGRTDVHELRRHLGVVDPSLVRLLDRGTTALELVATGFGGHLTRFFFRPDPQQQAVARQTLAQVGLADREDQPFATLSSGQRSRVWLARALVRQPQVLLLDEPTAELDLVGRETFLATLDAICLRHPKLTIVMITHHLEDLLPRTSNVLLLSDGRTVASGPPHNVLRSELVSDAFGCAVSVTQQEGRWRWQVGQRVWPRLIDVD